MNVHRKTEQPERLLTCQELADFLGKPVSWVRNNRHGLPHAMLGRQPRFRLSEVQTWLDAQRGGPRPGVDFAMDMSA